MCTFASKDYKKNSSGRLGGERKTEHLSSYRNGDLQRFCSAVLVGFRDLDHCLVVNDICITLVMTLGWVGWGALNSSLSVSAFK